MVWGAVIGAAASLGSAALSNRGARQSNAANREIARENNAFNANQAFMDRQWQHWMSSTAHVRQMQDMRAAGINPILSARLGGASTPGGATARAAPPIPMQNEFSGVDAAINTGLQIAKGASDIKLNNARSTLTETQDALTGSLVPGAEAIATITEQLRNLAEAAVEIAGVNKQTYKDTLNEMKGAMTDWFMKAHENGMMPTQIINNIIQTGGELKEGAIEILDEVKDTFSSPENLKRKLNLN